MIFLMTHAHKCVCLCSEGETPEENDSTTERNLPFVNKVTKEKLRSLPCFCKKTEICVLGNLYPWSNDRQIKWLRSRKTRPDLSPSPNSKIRAPGNFQETLQIEVGAVKMASAQQLREGLQDFTRTGCEWLRSGWRSREEEEAQCWCCQSPSAPPVQVGQRHPKYLLGSNSRFIHSDVIQRKLSKEWHLSEQVEDLNLIHLFASVLKQKLIFMSLTQTDFFVVMVSLRHQKRFEDSFPQNNPSTPSLLFKKNTTNLICWNVPILLSNVVMLKQLISLQQII